ncbi:MAG TPA: glycosyltransferase family 4 protein, partial [Anaerolineaceae bacterium]
VHIQSYHTFVPPLAMLAALRQRIPYVVTFHAGGNSSVLRNSVRRTQRAALKPLLRQANQLIALANFEIEQYGKELGLSPEHFVLIPNGCDLPEIPPLVKDRHDHPLIASVGRLERYKGHQRILTALPYILEQKPDARLWIAGTGPYEPELRRLARKLGVQDQVEIRAVPSGDRQRMAAELSRASLAVMLSEYETHPLAVLEALSLGVPALVADNSGLRELADAGLASRIRTDSSPQEIARAVIDQLDHPMIPAQLNLPTWDDCAASLFNLYASIIGIPVGEDFANINVEPVLPSHTGRD